MSYTVRLAWLLLSALWIALDLWTKNLAVVHLKGQPDIDVLPVLRWSYAENHGAAFSILAGNTTLLLVIGGLVSVFLMVTLLRTPAESWLASFGYASILGGALGNIIDRVSLGYVRDMISVYYTPWDFYFAIFNVADMAISVGVGALLLDWLFSAKKQKSQ